MKPDTPTKTELHQRIADLERERNEHRNAAMEADLRTQAAVRSEKQVIAENAQLQKLAQDAYAAWDSDQETKVGKLLRAMLDENFRKTYRPDLKTPNAEIRGD